MPAQLSAVVFGIGTVAEMVCRRIADAPAIVVAAIVCTSDEENPRLRELAEALGCVYAWQPDVNEAAFVERVASLRPDYLVSADNQRIFGEALLATAARAGINFHLGPLSRYRGSNLATWVIWNQEREHEVCWHVMRARVDSGDVVCRAHLTVDPGQTAYELTIECIQAGIDIIPELVAKMQSPEGLPTSPTAVAPTFYRKRDLPNGGVPDPSWDQETRDRFERALDYGPMPNAPRRPPPAA